MLLQIVIIPIRACFLFEFPPPPVLEESARLEKATKLSEAVVTILSQTTSRCVLAIEMHQAQELVAE